MIASICSLVIFACCCIAAGEMFYIRLPEVAIDTATSFKVTAINAITIVAGTTIIAIMMCL